VTASAKPGGLRERRFLRPGFIRVALLVVAVFSLAMLTASGASAACGNPVACENALPGDVPSDWQVNGIGDSTIQGYATQFSVNAGQTESFKIKTPSSAYHIDILRLGYYGGDGARIVASGIKPTATLPQTQPSCLTDSSTGLIDCGNWSVSASWTVPSNAVSGMYIAHLVRDDSLDKGGDSQIPFVVRNDSGHSDVVVATSDATWQAYNAYGGNSLYTCTVACPPGNPLAYKGAYAVSYNRPFDGAFSTDAGASYLWYVEYQMIYWLEENGYDVSYLSDSDLDSKPSLLQNHKLFMSSGHDEYWSENEYQGVKAALAHGVNLAFFSGNEMFWKTRWANSQDGSNTAYRTLITYKETHFNAPTDPQDPPTWTGAWADPRFSPPADGGVPANSLTGQEFLVNSGSGDLTVPSRYSKLRFWRNTAVANLSSGQTLTLAPGCNTLGYEWDADADNGYRPAGLFDLSSTTLNNVQPFIDYGSLTGTGTETHHLTLYRAPSGALAFGAGTVQWAWGLDEVNAWAQAGAPAGCSPDKNIEQATVNLFADMGVQPTTLISGLTPATQSSNTTPPTSRITSPTGGASFNDGTATTIAGTASSSGGVVAGVEVSTDGGNTWHPATLTTPDGASVSWSYNWVAQGNPSTTIMSRATDDSGNIEAPAGGVSVNVSCPCSLWGSGTPGGAPDSVDGNAVTIGMKFTSDQFGTINAIRFYKVSTNTGTHVGSLWTANGQLLESVTFTNETASGWQQANLATPVTIMPNTTYVVSYFAPNGHYAGTDSYFYRAPSPNPWGGATFNNPPLHAVMNNTSANGVFAYGSSNQFPTDTDRGDNYWVDVQFTASPAPGQVTGVKATAGNGAAYVTWSAPSTGGVPTSYTVTPYINGSAQSPTTVTGMPAPTGAAVTGLSAGTSYTFTVTASNPNGTGPPSSQSNAVTPSSGSSIPAFVQQVSAHGTGTSISVTPTSSLTVGNRLVVVAGVFSNSHAIASSVTDSAGDGFVELSHFTAPDGTEMSIWSGPILSGGGTTPPKITLTSSGSADLGIAASEYSGLSPVSDTTVVDQQAHASGTTTVAATVASGATPATTASNELAIGAYVDSGWSNTLTAGTGYTQRSNVSNTQDVELLTEDQLEAPAGATPNATVATGPNTPWVIETIVLKGQASAPPSAPGAPTNVSATAGNQSATVSWTAPSNGGSAITSYAITPYIGTTAQTPTVVSGSPPATIATVAGLTNGTAYTFTVMATNGVGTGPESVASNSVTPAAPPGAPTSVSATGGNGQAMVSWTAPANGGSAITTYTVTPYVGATAQTPTTVIGSPPATTTTVTGLTNGTAYTFTVSASNAVGTGPASNPSNSVTPAAPPGAPTSVTAAAGNAQATVSWTAPATGGSVITSYTVTPYVGTTAETPTVVTGSPPTTSAVVTGLTNGTTYTFTVTATNSAGSGPASAPSNTVTPTAFIVPAFVQQVAGHVGSATSLGVTPGSNITTGNRLVVVVGVWSGPGATAASVTDSAGNKYVELLHFKASEKTEMSVWTAPITAGGGTRPTITVKPTAKADLGIGALEYSGLSTATDATAVDVMAHASGTTSGSATVASGATSPTATVNELAVGLYVDSGFGDTLTAGSGWTPRLNVSPTNDIEFLGEDQIEAAGATPNATTGTGSKTTWLMSTVVFKHS
jgi:hypothetical protein